MAGPVPPVRLGKRILAATSRKNVPLLAAGIAYNALLSLAPLLIILFAVLSTVGGGLEARLVTAASTSLPGPIADVVTRIFRAGVDPGISVIGSVVLAWGSLKVFRGLDTAFSAIYETGGRNSFLDTILDALVVLIGLVGAVAGTIAASALFAAVGGSGSLAGLLIPLVLVVTLLLAFFPMFYRFPDTDVAWTAVLPGVVLAAVGWAALQGLFQVYLLFSGGGTPEFFGGLIVVIVWLYFSGLVILLGAVLNAVVGGHLPADATDSEHPEAAVAG